eukprot:13125077-Alexandrium_andersonii.AAC.1
MPVIMSASETGLNRPGRSASLGTADALQPAWRSARGAAGASRPRSQGTAPQCGPRRTCGPGGGRRG